MIYLSLQLRCVYGRCFSLHYFRWKNGIFIATFVFCVQTQLFLQIWKFLRWWSSTLQASTTDRAIILKITLRNKFFAA